MKVGKGVKYSVVVPVYKEEGNISSLHDEIMLTLSKLSGRHEVIYVNDGSTDNSLAELKHLKGNVKIINLNRNYGQSTALDAGFKAARGDIVISMDGDGQNDPRDIPRLLEKMKSDNLDVVAGWRKNRKDKGSIRTLTKIGRAMRRVWLKDEVHDTGCMLRVYTKESIKTLDLQGEMHRYILALLKWKGFRIGEIEVNHRPRLRGTSKYGIDKAVRGFIDLQHIWFIKKYSQRPLHVFGYLSLATLFTGLFSGALALYSKLFDGLSFNRNGWFFAAFFLLLASIMFFSFGIMIDLSIKNYMNNSPSEKRYYIKEIIADEKD